MAVISKPAAGRLRFTYTGSLPDLTVTGINPLDIVIGSDFVRTAVIIAFIANELISIIENAGLMGVPVPAAIRKGLEVLNNKNQKGE